MFTPIFQSSGQESEDACSVWTLGENEVMQYFPNGFPLTLCIPAEEPTKEFTLPASATKTSIPNLRPDVDYLVTISAYAGSEESLPVSGQITRESPGPRVFVSVCVKQQISNRLLAKLVCSWMMTMSFSLENKVVGSTSQNLQWTKTPLQYITVDLNKP